MKTILNNVTIGAIASWLPENRLDIYSLSALYGENEVKTIVGTTGITELRIANKDMTSSDMCQRAAEHLLEAEGVDRSVIDGLVFVSQTPDYILPSTSTCIQDRLGLSKDTVCQDIRYGCSGYIYGIFTAALWVSSGACKNVLVLSGDTNSRIVNENDRSLRMVMGDAGTATLVTEGEGTLGFHIQSDGSGAERLIIPAGGFRTPCSEQTKVLEWDEDHNGRTQEDMFMDGMAIFGFAINKVPRNIKFLLDYIGWEKDEVGLYALHQANKFMVDFIGKKTKVPSEKVPVDADKYGNTGPATIPLLLSDVCNRIHFDLSKVVLCGFGVGLSWGSITCDLSQTHFYEPINK